MIFVTVGSQLQFDRMIQMVDETAPVFPHYSFIAQTGDSVYEAKNIKTYNTLIPLEFDNYVRDSKLIISHAGIGTILLAAENSKPLIVVPRSARLHEARNDHQFATCNLLKEKLSLHVATCKEELESLLHKFSMEGLSPIPRIQQQASDSLITSLKQNIEILGKQNLF